MWHEESNLANAWEMTRCPQRRLIDEGSFVHIEVDMMLGGRFSSWWSLKGSQWLERLQWVCHGLPQPIYIWPRVKNVKMVKYQNHSINQINTSKSSGM